MKFACLYTCVLFKLVYLLLHRIGGGVIVVVVATAFGVRCNESTELERGMS